MKSRTAILPRVIAGSAKGIRLRVPSSARPITDRMKQSLCDTISQIIPGAHVLDLFAGAGSLGIEALSRGAALCTFVEIDAEALDAIRHNLTITRLSTQAVVEATTVQNFLRHSSAKFDVVFIDPPFKSDQKAIPATLVLQHLTDDGVVVVKQPRRQSYPTVAGLEVVHQDNFGANNLVYLRKSV